MSCKKGLKRLTAGRVKIFKIVNRRGYAALCLGNLTEGANPLLAYRRMQKAVRRGGWCLPEQDAGRAKKLVHTGI